MPSLTSRAQWRWLYVLAACLATSPIWMSLCQPSYAGECTEGTEDYVEKLEEASRAGPPFSWGEGFQCLDCPTPSWAQWAGPIAARRFDDCRTSPYRDRIAAACLAFLEAAQPDSSEWFQPRIFAAELLAYYGVGHDGDYDAFEILAGDWDARRRLGETRLMALACLRDPRTVPFLSQSYDAICAHPDRRKSEQVGSILNCLYHQPDPQAVELATRIQNSESDPAIRARAQRVIAR